MNKIENDYIRQLLNNNIDENEVDKIEVKPMTDADIKHYFPKSKILTNEEIGNYNSIDELLPNNTDWVFILYQQSPNYGHWCLLTKKNNMLNYFDSYGGNIDDPLNWISKEKRNKLNEEPYLTELINNSNYDCEYNGVDFQSENSKISTCGRHCCLRLKTLLNNDLDMDEYIDLMKGMKKRTKMTYDEIVSDLINKI